MDVARFSFTVDDLIAAQRAWWVCAARWQSALKTFAVIALFYAALGLASTWSAPARVRVEGVALGVAGALIVTLLVFVVGLAMAPRRARQAFREHKALVGQFTIEWDEQGIVIRHDSGQTTLSWNKFYAWGIGPQTLMLYQTSKLFHAIPRRAIDDAVVQQIVERLRLADVPERKRFGFRAWKPQTVGAAQASDRLRLSRGTDGA